MPQNLLFCIQELLKQSLLNNVLALSQGYQMPKWYTSNENQKIAYSKLSRLAGSAAASSFPHAHRLIQAILKMSYFINYCYCKLVYSPGLSLQGLFRPMAST